MIHTRPALIPLFAAPTTLYRFFDADGALLYIGISVDFEGRRSQHQADKPWWPKVATWRLERYPNRLDAALAEREAVIAELPRYNIVYHPARQPTARVIDSHLRRKVQTYDPKVELAEQIAGMAKRFGIPADHAEVMMREAMADLELENQRSALGGPRVISKAEYQEALAMQAKRKARESGDA